MSHGIVTPGDDLRASAPRARSPNPELQQALRNLDRRLLTARESSADHPELKDRGRRDPARDARRSRRLARPARGARSPGSACTCTGPRRPADARRIIVGDRAATRRVDPRGEVEVDGDRGDRPRGRARGARASRAVETDLGEYIVQVAGERPSHMIVPAIHKTLAQVARRAADRAADDRLPVEREAITAWARDHLRARVPRRRPRHHRRELRRRRHRDARARHQRGQRRPLHDHPAGADRGGAGREGDPALLGPRRRCCRCSRCSATGPAHLELRDDDQRAAPRRARSTARRAARRVARPRPPRAARHAVRGHARLHPLRRVPQRVPGVPAQLAGTRTTRSTAGRWARCSRPCCRSTAPRAATCPRRRRCAARAPRRARWRSRSPTCSSACAPTCAGRARSIRCRRPPHRLAPASACARPGRGLRVRASSTTRARVARRRRRAARRAAFDAWAAALVHARRATARRPRSARFGARGVLAVDGPDWTEAAAGDPRLDRDPRTRRCRRRGRSGDQWDAPVQAVGVERW